jgi:hypothetical protein
MSKKILKCCRPKIFNLVGLFERTGEPRRIYIHPPNAVPFLYRTWTVPRPRQARGSRGVPRIGTRRDFLQDHLQGKSNKKLPKKKLLEEWRDEMMEVVIPSRHFAIRPLAACV